jgi:hypothetical protein
VVERCAYLDRTYSPIWDFIGPVVFAGHWGCHSHDSGGVGIGGAGGADAAGAGGANVVGTSGASDTSVGWEWRYPFTEYSRSGGAGC